MEIMINPNLNEPSNKRTHGLHGWRHTSESTTWSGNGRLHPTSERGWVYDINYWLFTQFRYNPFFTITLHLVNKTETISNMLLISPQLTMNHEYPDWWQIRHSWTQIFLPSIRALHIRKNGTSSPVTFFFFFFFFFTNGCSMTMHF